MEKPAHNLHTQGEWVIVEDALSVGTSVIKFWGPHDFGDPGSPISYEYGDPIINLGTPKCCG